MKEKTTFKKSEISDINVNFLVLEDMNNLREQMVSDLKLLGIRSKIFEAADVKTAISISSSNDIGFVISDWNLPDGTGHDFLKVFKSVEHYKKTPFIMCTTNSDISYFLEAVKSGANDFIVKPWTIEELKKKIEVTWDLLQKKKL